MNFTRTIGGSQNPKHSPPPELEKGAGRPSKEILPDDRKNSKSETLAAAGIPVSTANDYEQLTGGREKPRSAIRPCRLGELEGRLRFWRCCFPRLARLL